MVAKSAFVFGMVASACGQRSPNFPPGWNGLATKPPMGWRSWNAWGNRVSQDLMTNAIDALTARSWTVDGRNNVSLFEAGYNACGIDEGWEGCGAGINGTQHDAAGLPTVNAKFPNTSALVEHGHSKGLLMGWYENGCACGERHGLEINYEGDVRSLSSFGFDGVKLDGCGAQRNMTLYAELMNATGKGYLIENCHWGRCTNSDDSSCPTADWCPFNWFRTSGDINASPMSWFHNLQTTIAFQDRSAPLARPGCWAYPDMLEVGRINGADGKLDLPWNRAHFGAWCVVSSPLILGLDITKPALLGPVVPIITNPEAIAVNQAWAGHPGGLVWSDLGGAFGFPAARKCAPSNTGLKQAGWSLAPLPNAPKPTSPTATAVSLAAPGGGCLRIQGGGYPGGAGGTVVVKCNATDAAQQFEYDTATLQLRDPKSGHCVDVHSGGPIVWMYGCTKGANDLLHLNKTDGTVSVDVGGTGEGGLCFGVETADPAGSTVESTLQAWAKPLEGSDGVALLLINPDSVSHDFEVPLSVLPTKLAAPIKIRDIWQRADLPVLAASATTVKMTVGAKDSAFLRLH